MRVAFLSYEFPPHIQGGAGVYADRLSRALAARGLDVHVIGPGSHARREEHAGATVHRVAVPRGVRFPAGVYWARAARHLRHLRRQEGPFDVVHGNSTSDLLVLRARAPRVLTLHHLARAAAAATPLADRVRSGIGSETGLGPLFERACVRRADRIAVPSVHTAREVGAAFPGLADRVRVVPNGVDVPHPASADAVPAYRDRYTAGADVLCLMVGRLNDPRKGFEDGLRAFAHAARDAKAALVVAGAGDPGPLMHLAEREGVAERVRFVGEASPTELALAYHAADACLVPSRLEGFGLVAAEAHASGTPVVGYAAGALPEVVTPETGRLVPVGDRPALAEALTFVLRDEPARRRMATAAKKAARRWTWDRVARDVEALYESTVG